MCISVSQLVRNIGIAVFAGIAAFARLRCFNSINVDAMDAHSLRANLLSVNISIADTILLNSVNNIETGRDKVDMSGESKKDEKQYLNRLIREGEVYTRKKHLYSHPNTLPREAVVFLKTTLIYCSHPIV